MKIFFRGNVCLLSAIVVHNKIYIAVLLDFFFNIIAQLKYRHKQNLSKRSHAFEHALCNNIRNFISNQAENKYDTPKRHSL